MTVRLSPSGTLELAGACTLEDAEPLQRYLALAQPGGTPTQSVVEWEACEQLHTGVLQVLLAASPTLRGTPKSDFLRNHVVPLFKAGL